MRARVPLSYRRNDDIFSGQCFCPYEGRLFNAPNPGDLAAFEHELDFTSLCSRVHLGVIPVCCDGFHPSGPGVGRKFMNLAAMGEAYVQCSSQGDTFVVFQEGDAKKELAPQYPEWPEWVTECGKLYSKLAQNLALIKSAKRFLQKRGYNLPSISGLVVKSKDKYLFSAIHDLSSRAVRTLSKGFKPRTRGSIGTMDRAVKCASECISVIGSLENAGSNGAAGDLFKSTAPGLVVNTAMDAGGRSFVTAFTKSLRSSSAEPFRHEKPKKFNIRANMKKGSSDNVGEDAAYNAIMSHIHRASRAFDVTCNWDGDLEDDDVNELIHLIMYFPIDERDSSVLFGHCLTLENAAFLLRIYGIDARVSLRARMGMSAMMLEGFSKTRFPHVPTSVLKFYGCLQEYILSGLRAHQQTVFNTSQASHQHTRAVYDKALDNAKTKSRISTAARGVGPKFAVVSSFDAIKATAHLHSCRVAMYQRIAIKECESHITGFFPKLRLSTRLPFNLTLLEFLSLPVLMSFKIEEKVGKMKELEQHPVTQHRHSIFRDTGFGSIIR